MAIFEQETGAKTTDSDLRLQSHSATTYYILKLRLILAHFRGFVRSRTDLRLFVPQAASVARIRAWGRTMQQPNLYRPAAERRAIPALVMLPVLSLSLGLDL